MKNYALISTLIIEEARIKPNLYLGRNKDKKRQLTCRSRLERLITKKIIAIEVSEVEGRIDMIQLRL